MVTYEDLVEVREKNNDSLMANFVISTIGNYKSSERYKEAVIAYDYFRRRNTTIHEYQKLLYTISGEAVPDN